LEGIAINRYRNTVVIYNPASGKLRRNPRLIQRTIQALGDQGIDARAEPTTGPGAAADIARKAVDRDVDLILAAGGDGTINEVINGVIPSLVPVGIVPAGTANVLACELGVGTRYVPAIQNLEGYVSERIAVGLLTTGNGERRYFLLMAGVGLDAQIVYDLSPGLKSVAGKFAYWVGGFKHLTRRVGQFDVRMNDEAHRCGFALASRVRNYGGDLTIAGGANILEDDFELVLFEGRNPARYAVYFLGVVAGILPRMRGITVERTQKIELSASGDSRVYVQVDGEYAGRLPASIEIVPDALSLLMPADFRTQILAKVTHGLAPAPS